LKLAKINGAIGVILENNVPGDSIVTATLSADNVGLMVPIGTVRQAVGLAWRARLVAGETLSVRLVVDGFLEIRETFNIISETKEGDPNNVIFVGAHLDSVQAGPGINDDGSGTSAILEILTGIRYFKGYKNKVRFAWWGAEVCQCEIKIL
jgi:Iap family predicted aminopeptidase